MDHFDIFHVVFTAQFRSKGNLGLKLFSPQDRERSELKQGKQARKMERSGAPGLTMQTPLRATVGGIQLHKRPDGPCPRVSRDRQKPDRFVAMPACSRAHTSTTARLLTAVVPCVGGAHTDADWEILPKCSKRLKSEAHAEPPVCDDVDSDERGTWPGRWLPRPC